MTRLIVLSLCVSAVTYGRPPATRPADPAPPTPVGPRDRPMALNPQRPAFVPAFATPDHPPAGHYAERQYAYRFGYPSPFGYGFGGYGWAYGDYGFGDAYGWGGTAVEFR